MTVPSTSPADPRTPPAQSAPASADTFNGVTLAPTTPPAQPSHNAGTPRPQPLAIPNAPQPAASPKAPTPTPPPAADQVKPQPPASTAAPLAIATTVQQSPTSPAWPPAIVLPLDTEIPDRAPGHPKTLSLSLNGSRRHKLHALRAVLRTQKATIHTRRGGAEGEQLVLTFNDTLLWLLDQVEIDARLGDGD